MNPIEKIALEFLIKEAKNNPTLLSGLIGHILTQAKVDPKIVGDISDVLNQILPMILTNVTL